MGRLLRRWLPRQPVPVEALPRIDHRPMLAAAMCEPCARRWLRGRSVWHPWCSVSLRHAFDLYFEKLQS